MAKRFVLKTLQIGWPPSVTIAVEPGRRDLERDQLHPLFVWLADRTLLLRGTGAVKDINELYDKVDKIRGELTRTVQKLGPRDVALWIDKLSDACQELLKETAKATRSPEAPDFGPAVDELREAFRESADRVAKAYDLPAARKLADRIHNNAPPL
jgi:hypothetical protein